MEARTTAGGQRETCGISRAMRLPAVEALVKVTRRVPSRGRRKGGECCREARGCGCSSRGDGDGDSARPALGELRGRLLGQHQQDVRTGRFEQQGLHDGLGQRFAGKYGRNDFGTQADRCNRARGRRADHRDAARRGVTQNWRARGGLDRVWRW